MRKKKDELAARLQAAKTSGRYMVAVWAVINDKVEFFRQTEGFPLGDLPTAQAMLKDDLDEMTGQKEVK